MVQRPTSGNGRNLRRGVTAVLVVMVALGLAGPRQSSQPAGVSQTVRFSFGTGSLAYPIRIPLGQPRLSPKPSPSTAGRLDMPFIGALSFRPLDTPLPALVQPENASQTKKPNSSADGTDSKQDIGEFAPNRLLRLTYSIEAGRSSETISIRKRIQVNGVDRGEATIRISDGSAPAIRAKDVIALGESELGQSALVTLAGADYIDFEDLRSSGLMIRYDAVHDRVLLSSSAP